MEQSTNAVPVMRRGEIYWIGVPDGVGHEMKKDRPGIVVSCDALNVSSPLIQVVYLSSSPKRDLPEHVTIRSAAKVSTAMCETVYTVDKSRVKAYVGRCTEREMEQVGLGLLSGLGLAFGSPQEDLASPQESGDEDEPVWGGDEERTASAALVIAQTERDTYRRMYEDLLDRLTGVRA